MTKLEQAINNAINYVDNSRKYNIACRVIDNLIKQIKSYIDYVTNEMHDHEIELLNIEYQNKEIKRLKRIISIYDGNDRLSDEQISLLESLKERTQFYTGNSADYILFKYKYIDIVLNNKIPSKKTRPETIEQIESAYKILSEKYGNSKN